ncbi:unnamed protein product [Vicia faba]|uniref:F-box domain-containing protein n=1 Tax=Vicia faba TaxID=3906 RepID=A0AAV0YY83_VICFA|nr:unnamed protein product [Vicia faba]
MAVMTRNRRRKMTEATSESINTVLPVELVIEILSLIELTNPLELRCVCKWWNLLMVDPQFVESYLHRSFSDIIGLTLTAMEHIESFESRNVYVPAIFQEDGDDDDEDEEEATELLMNKADQLDRFLVILDSMKRNLNTMKVDMVALKKRVKCFESFLKIYLKSVAESSSSSV